MRYLITLFLGCGLLSCACSEQRLSEDANEKTEVLTETSTVNQVDTIVLAMSEFKGELLSNGKLRAFKKYDLNFPGSGVLTRLTVANGQMIQKGDLIAALDNRVETLKLHQSDQLLSKAEMEFHDILLGFGYSITDTSSTPQEIIHIARLRSGYDVALMEVAAAKLALEATMLYAPLTGKIANLTAKLHEKPKGDTFCTLFDDSWFDVTFPVMEGEINKIRQGQEVSILLFGESGKRFRGRVESINPMVDEKGMVNVRALIRNTDKELMDGRNVKVFVESTLGKRLVVPKNAVLIRDNHQVLFTINGQGRASWVYVIVEGSNSTSYAVRADKERNSELKSGDCVIVGGNLNLADGSPVVVVKR